MPITEDVEADARRARPPPRYAAADARRPGKTRYVPFLPGRVALVSSDADAGDHRFAQPEPWNDVREVLLSFIFYHGLYLVTGATSLLQQVFW
ncbi:hypothetical protein [Sphingomonas corticis]|uniref:Uncharacterized protein n=1 Tax=Sphingomonas corticis TaxID=2722791 RepID=A0ABX1CTR5_9SPHN|nr:hypothetical protein [Sphingomonas corticis]NJR80028.1 hypothetical protein [Sphingomonas corticis]